MSRALRVFPLFLVAMAFGTLVLRASSSLTNGDTFFHLRIGAHFLHDWTPWAPGHLNRFATGDWAPTQWLSQVTMAWVAAHFGLAGVAWLSGLWFIVLAIAAYIACRRCSPSLVAAVVTALVIFACSSGLSARPQVLSYALIAVTVDAWLRTAEDGRIRWWLVPLAWLWAMLHGMWVLGVVTSFVAAAGVALDADHPNRRSLRPFLVPLGMALASAATPAGPALYRSVFLVGSRSSIFNEWKPPNFATPDVGVLGLMVGSTIVLALRRPDRSSWLRTGLIALACAWAVYVERTVPIAAVTVAPLLAFELAPYVPDRGQVRGERWWVAGLAVTALAALLLTAPAAGRIHQPRWVRPALTSLAPGTAVLADWAPSGYLVWAYPNLAPVMTGYADMYTDAELHRFVRLMALRPGWDHTVSRYGVRIALLDPSSPLAYALRTQLHWQVRHRAHDVEMLLAPSAAPG